MTEFDGQRILITGAAGFIGSAVTNAFVNKYPDKFIYGLDKMSYCSNLNNLKSSLERKNFKFIQGDICESDFMKYIFNEYEIDTVMHFAAYSHVDHSFGNSLIFSQNNIIGTHTLLEVSKINKHRIKRFIHVSTDEVYGDNEGSSDEKSLMNPTNPYSASKAAAECLVRGYYHSYNIPVIITRGNNVYGPCQYPEKAIPRFCLRLLQGKKCEIQGDGKQTRSFLYIDDVVHSFDYILNKGIVGETYNISSVEEISVLTVVKELVKVIHSKDNNQYDEYISFVKDREFNDKRYLISGQKLESLGWKQEISFQTGLRKTLEWYKDNAFYWDQSDLGQALEQNNRTIH